MMRKRSATPAPDSHLQLEPPFEHVDGVARAQWVIARCFDLVNEGAELAGDAVRAFARALGVAATDGDSLLDCHPRHEGILAGEAHLAEDEKRPVLRDVYGDLRIPDELTAEPGGDGTLEVYGRTAACAHGADQRNGDVTDLIDSIDARKVRLSVDEHPQPVAGIEDIWLEAGRPSGEGGLHDDGGAPCDRRGRRPHG